MPVTTTHPDYDSTLPVWLRARDVFAGEDAVRAAGIRYLPRLDLQSDDEYAAYKARASFFNATARTGDGFVGLIFRREPTVKLPEREAGVAGALRVFAEDVDLMGTSLYTYSKHVVSEVITVGRAGTLVDWESEGQARAYVVRYCERKHRGAVVLDAAEWDDKPIEGVERVKVRNGDVEIFTLVEIARRQESWPDGRHSRCT